MTLDALGELTRINVKTVTHWSRHNALISVELMVLSMDSGT